MKHGKKPTRVQKQILSKRKLNPEDWLVVKDTPDQMLLVHKHFDHVTKAVPKVTGREE